MPGAAYMIERHNAAAQVERTPASEQPAREPMTDHAAGLREACEKLTADLRVYVEERMVTA